MSGALTRGLRGHSRLNAASMLAFVAYALWLVAVPAPAETVCMVVASTSGAMLDEEGDCRTLVTPASTFKLALSLIGFDSGLLNNAHDPLLDYRKGDPDWGGKARTRPNDPESWLRHSVVWYSQRITHALGAHRLSQYAKALGYGNADLSGDPAQDNGLERAWIASSLKISPVEQVTFLGNLIENRLPVAQNAVEKTTMIVESRPAGDWTVWGKTGAAYPRQADGSFDRTRGWGWFVGWARCGNQTLVFARLDQDRKRHAVSAGLRTRAALLEAWPALAEAITERR